MQVNTVMFLLAYLFGLMPIYLLLAKIYFRIGSFSQRLEAVESKVLNNDRHT